MARKKQITLISKKVVIKIGEVTKLEAGKSYILNVPDHFDFEDHQALQAEFNKRGITDVIVVCSNSMTVYEVPEKVTADIE